MLVVLAGMWLGPAAGAASMVLYLAAGAAGLPVFTPIGAPGIARFFGPTGGYLLAYPAAAWVAGALNRARVDARSTRWLAGDRRHRRDLLRRPRAAHAAHRQRHARRSTRRHAVRRARSGQGVLRRRHQRIADRSSRRLICARSSSTTRREGFALSGASSRLRGSRSVRTSSSERPSASCSRPGSRLPAAVRWPPTSWVDVRRTACRHGPLAVVAGPRHGRTVDKRPWSDVWLDRDAARPIAARARLRARRGGASACRSAALVARALAALERPASPALLVGRARFACHFVLAAGGALRGAPDARLHPVGAARSGGAGRGRSSRRASAFGAAAPVEHRRDGRVGRARHARRRFSRAPCCTRRGACTPRGWRISPGTGRWRSSFTRR